MHCSQYQQKKRCIFAQFLLSCFFPLSKQRKSYLSSTSKRNLPFPSYWEESLHKIRASHWSLLLKGSPIIPNCIPCSHSVWISQTLTWFWFVFAWHRAMKVSACLPWISVRHGSHGINSDLVQGNTGRKSLAHLGSSSLEPPERIKQGHGPIVHQSFASKSLQPL